MSLQQLLTDIRENKITKVEGLEKIIKPETRELKRIKLGNYDEARSILSLTDETLAVGEGRIIKIWNIKTGACIKTFTSEDDSVVSLVKLSDEFITACYSLGSVKIWNVKTGTYYDIVQGSKRAPAAGSNDKRVRSIAALSTETLALGKQGLIEIWNVTTNTLHATLPSQLSNICSLAPLGNNLLAAGGYRSYNGTIEIWDLKTNTCIKTLSEHNSNVYTLKLIGNKFLVSESADGIIKIWNLETYTCHKTLTEHKRGAYSTNDTYLAALPYETFASYKSCTASDLTIWDAASGLCLQNLELSSTIKSIETLADGSLAVGCCGEIAIVKSELLPIKLILRALKTNASVTSLDLSNLKFDMECWQELAALLAVNTNITEINLTNTGLNSAAWDTLMQTLINANLTRIPRIISAGNSINFDYTSLQLSALIASKKLEMRSAASPANITLALKMLIKNPETPAILNLSNYDLTQEHIEFLCQIIITCSQLQSLNLSNTNLTDLMAQSLLKALRQSNTLKSLDISGNALQEQTIAAMKQYSLEIAGNALPKSIILPLQACLHRKSEQLIDIARGVLLQQQEEQRKLIALIPPEFRCPITKKIMVNPVVAANGEIYEREAISKWLETHDTVPGSALPLPHKTLNPINRVKKQISEFLEQHKILLESDEVYLSEKLIAQLLQSIAEKNVESFTQIIRSDRRLLTRLFDEKQKTTLLTIVCQKGNTALLKALLSILGDKFWQLPEILQDNGVNIFQTIAINFGHESAALIAKELAFSSEEINAQLQAAHLMAKTDLKNAVKLAYVCLILQLQTAKIDAAALFHFIAREIHNPELAIEILKLVQSDKGIKFMQTAAMVLDTNGQSALTSIVQYKDDAVFLALPSLLNFDANSLYDAVQLANPTTGWNAAHMIARCRSARTMQYLLETLNYRHLNALLTLQTKDGENLLKLTAANQDSKTFMPLLQKASPEALRTALGNQQPSALLAEQILKQHSQAHLDLLNTKYHLIVNCSTLQKELDQALQILSTGKITKDWIIFCGSLEAKWQKLQPHFNSVLVPSADYEVVNQLQKSWKQFAEIQALIVMFDNKRKLSTTERRDVQTLLQKILSSSLALSWETLLPPDIFDLIIAALNSQHIIKTNQFAWVNLAIDPLRWEKFIHALPKTLPNLSISLPTSFNPKLLVNHPELHELDISNNPLGQTPALIDNLATQLAGHCKLMVLKLNSCGFNANSDSLVTCCNLLHKLPALTELELRGANLQGKNFMALIEYLRTNPPLLKLDLRECNLNLQQISQLVETLAEHNLNLTGCLFDATVGAKEELQRLTTILSRNQNKIELEKQYQEISNHIKELTMKIQNFKLNQDMTQLLQFADTMEREFRNNNEIMQSFAKNYYPSTSEIIKLQDLHLQSAAWLIKLWSCIISREKDQGALLSYYARADRLRNEFISRDQNCCQELNNAYAISLLSMPNTAQNFQQVSALLNTMPRELISAETAKLFSQSCGAFIEYSIKNINGASILADVFAICHDLLHLTASSAFLLCDEKAEIKFKQDIYSAIAQLVIKISQNQQKCNLSVCKQLFQILRGIPQDYHDSTEITQALLPFTKVYLLNFLRNLQQSVGRFFGFTRSDVEACIKQIETSMKLADILQFAENFSIKWRGEAVKYSQINEMAALIFDVRNYTAIVPRDIRSQAIQPIIQPMPITSKLVEPSAPPMPVSTETSAKLYPALESATSASSSKLSFFGGNFPWQSSLPTNSKVQASVSQPQPQFQPSAPPLPLIAKTTAPEHNPIQDLLNQCSQLHIDLGDAKPDWLDCISHEIMVKPVVTKAGNTYDEKSITEWFSSNDTDPLTGLKVTNKELFPNGTIHGQIMEYLENKIHCHKQPGPPH